MKSLSRTLAFVLLLASTSWASAADLSVADALPVFHKGRVKPLQSFAREVVDKVYDRQNKVRLSLEGYFEIEDRDNWERLTDQYKGDEWQYIVQQQLAQDPKYAGVLDLFPDGKPQAFEPTEIVLSWLMETEKWEYVPFIYAPHEELRKVLGVKTETGRLKYVSPHDVYYSESLREYLNELHARQEAAKGSGEFEPTALDELVQELLDRYNAWRALAFDPRQPLTLNQVAGPGTRGRFVRQITSAIDVANARSGQGESFAGRLNALASVFGSDSDAPLVREIVATLTALDELQSLGRKLVQQLGAAPDDVEGAPVTLEEAAASVRDYRTASRQLAEALRTQKTRIFESQSGLSAAQVKLYRQLFRELASKAEELHRLSLEMHATLYDEGESLHVTPALNPYALAKHRDTQNTAQPWLSLQAVLYGDDLLQDYPQARIHKVRRAWNDLKTAFVARHDEESEPRLQKAQEDLAVALRELGESVEPLRRKAVEATLPQGEQDEVLLAYTAYPQQWRINAEVRYNNTDPFKWSWVLSLLALACFCIAFGAARKPMFWTGVGILTLCAVWTAYGFALRVLVTGWAPVTNMYETVVYVPWVMLLLGLWFLLLPLAWTGIRNAWRATAVPFTWEAADLDDSQRYVLGPKGWTALNWAVLPFRFAVMAGFFVFLSVMELGHGGRAYFPLLPNLADVAGFGGMANSLGVWFVGIVCLALTVWFGPRFILAAALSPIFMLISWRQPRALARMAADVYPRQTFAGAAAGGACFFFLIAWWAPVLDESFQPLQPVLRSNFWLTIHVLTIVASYGAGMLAWGLGLIGMFYLAFGKYRNPAVPARVPKGMKPADHSDEYKATYRRPPEQVSVLANYAYRAIQVAVLLLAAGTILGGLWADVSWGRFWGWDPKEVWALISLLVYLAILHGRFAGWFNHVGLIFGTVVGAVMIVLSWYGVNFLLPMIAGGSVGLHSYGEGAGGQIYVLSFLFMNLMLIPIVAARYTAATSAPQTPAEDVEIPIPAELVTAEAEEGR